MPPLGTDGGFRVDRLEKLDEPPAPLDPSTDGVFWEADVADDEDGPVTVHPWMTDSDYIAIADGTENEWLMATLELFYRVHCGESIPTMYAFGRIQLRADPS